MNVLRNKVAITDGSMVAVYRIQGLVSTQTNSLQYRAENRLLSSSVLIEEYYPNMGIHRQHDDQLVITHTQFHKDYIKLEHIGNQMNLLPYSNLQSLNRVLALNNTLYWIKQQVAGIALNTYIAQNGALNDYTKIERWFKPIFEGLHLHHRLERPWLAIQCNHLVITENQACVLLAPSMEDCLHFQENDWKPVNDLHALLNCLYEAISLKTPPSLIERKNALAHKNSDPWQPLIAAHYPKLPKAFIQALNKSMSFASLNQEPSALHLSQLLFSKQTAPRSQWFSKSMSVVLGLGLVIAAPTPARQDSSNWERPLAHSNKILLPSLPEAPPKTPPPLAKTKEKPAPAKDSAVGNPKLSTQPVVPKAITKPVPTETSANNQKACILGLKTYCHTQ